MNYMGQGLTGRTLGLVGAGGIGQEILRLALPFFARMIVADPYAEEGSIRALGAEIRPLDAVMREADFVVVCCLLNDETRHLIAGLTFRAELFIVTSIIAWTYLLHAWYQRAGIDYRYKDKAGIIQKTKHGAECYWELSKCLRHPRCPADAATISNLDFLIDLRNEIEHRSTNRIDNAVSAKLQACCINFNNTIKDEFGAQFGLERRLPIALQFVTFSTDQRENLKPATDLPAHIAAMMDSFHNALTPAQQADPKFAYRVAFVPKVSNRASNSDLAVEFVKPRGGQ